MNEMIERVSRAICRTTFEGLDGAALEEMVDECWCAWEDAARAAISAMREPPGEMRQAYFEQSGDRFQDDGWSKAIDAALKPPS